MSLSADSFALQCVHIESEARTITVTCFTESILMSLKCAVDKKPPENCEWMISYTEKCLNCFMFGIGALQFELDPESYSDGPHTLTVMATNQNGETDQYSFTFGILL